MQQHQRLQGVELGVQMLSTSNKETFVKIIFHDVVTDLLRQIQIGIFPRFFVKFKKAEKCGIG